MRKLMAIVLSVIVSSVWAADRAPRLLQAQDLPVEVESTALQLQYNALSAMSLESIEYSSRGSVQFIRGDTGIVLPSSARNLKEGDSATAILPYFADILLANGNESLKVRSNGFLDSSTRALKLSQVIRGIPVIQGGVAIEYDDATKRVTGLAANFVPDRGLPTARELSAKRAEHLIPEILAKTEEFRTAEIRVLEGTYLGYYASVTESAPPQLVWVVRVQFKDGTEEFYFVDAATGALVSREPANASLISRAVYDANFDDPTIPNQLPPALTQSQINSNLIAKVPYDHVETVDTKLRLRFPYATVDFPGNAVNVVIQYLFSSPNATWKLANGKDYLSFSPADSIHWEFSKPRDIVAHEYGHGIAARAFGFSGDTIFDAELPALRESFADIMATVVDVAVRGAPVSATWIQGDGLFKANSAKGHRSFANPTGDLLAHHKATSKDWFPQRVMGPNVQHSNSTILSHAYFLLVNGGYHSRAVAQEIPEILVPALGEAPAREIFFRGFRDISMDFSPTHLKLKVAAMNIAGSNYGPAAQTATKKAFEAVGIGYQCTAAPNSTPPVNLNDIMCAGRFFPSWPAMPGVNRYIAQVTPVNIGWALAFTVTDGDVTSCTVQVSTPSYFRIRACNNCGCGPWSDPEYLEYWSPCP